MEKERQEALEWFTNFSNINLQEIKPGDKAKLLIESEEYLYPKKELEQLQKWPSSGSRVLDMPLSSKQAQRVAWALPGNIPPRDSKKYWSMILHVQEAVRKLFERFIPSAPMITARGSDEIHYLISWGREQPFTITYFPITKNQDDYVCFKILELLRGLPSHAIRKCPGCKKFFFNPTGREKNFCSPRCMWKVNATKRRDADKEGYRKYHREYMTDLRRQDAGLRPLKIRNKKARRIGFKL